MIENRKQSWSAAETVPLILLCLIGLSILLAAPVRLPSTIVPHRMPRLSPPTKPSPANKPMLADQAPASQRMVSKTDVNKAPGCEELS